MTTDISARIEETIRKHHGVAHLATAVDGRPHVAPVFYYYESGAVYVITGGQKLGNLRENPRVAVSLYEHVGDHPEDVRQVVILGTANLVDDWIRVKAYGDRIRGKYYGETSDEWPTRDSTLVRIDIGSISCRG
jgi:nitroimidazol reductase NimA-like FMN-containing flavoprotein (pyridoxamine 5'-phosphate oxidase superfamily)